MKNLMSFFLGFFLIGLCIFISIRILAGNNHWVCQRGEWVKIGQPIVPKPFARCNIDSSTSFDMPANILFFNKNTLKPTEIRKGIIEGSLGYPGEMIPQDMQVCASEIQSKKNSCTSSHIKDEKYTYGEGYRIEVSPGEYFVYAFLPQEPDNKAYYSDFVVCGFGSNCTSHLPIKISISKDEIRTGIDPQDWYAPK